MVTWPLWKCRPPHTQFFVSLWVRHRSSVFIDTNYIFFQRNRCLPPLLPKLSAFCSLAAGKWTERFCTNEANKKKQKNSKLHLWSFTGNIEFWKQKYLTPLITCTSTRWEMWVVICTAIFPVLLLVQLEKITLLFAVTVRYPDQRKENCTEMYAKKYLRSSDGRSQRVGQEERNR